MTAHFQFFMILGAAILLLIIFALLKKGQMSKDRETLIM